MARVMNKDQPIRPEWLHELHRAPRRWNECVLSGAPQPPSEESHQVSSNAGQKLHRARCQCLGKLLIVPVALILIAAASESQQQRAIEHLAVPKHQTISPIQTHAERPKPQEAPSAQQQQQPQPLAADMSRGPGVDLVALNWRRFELEHKHQAEQDTSGDELERSELIESQVAAIPERVLGQMPEELTNQLVESLAADPALVLGSRELLADAPGHLNEDPHGASIERLTKSCLTVQASSLTPDQLNVTFHLFTRRNAQRPFLVRPQASRAELVHNSPLEPSKPIKWITHGFHTNLDKSEWMLEAKDKILAHEDANVFLTDWRRGASPALAFYPKAAANAHVVARMIVMILKRLRADIRLSRVHLIGHSLGAHIMGFVGSAFTEEFLQRQQQQLATRRRDRPSASGVDSAPLTAGAIENQLVGRVTACDPALPCFGPSSRAPNSKMSGAVAMQQVASKFKQPAGKLARFGSIRRFRRQSAQWPPRAQLWPADSVAALALAEADWTPAMWTHLRPDSAILVEVMHSNPGVMGYAEPLGDFDFYPNGSERQPGCTSAPSAPLAPAEPVMRAGKRELRPGEPSERCLPSDHSARWKRQQPAEGLVGSIMQSVASQHQHQEQRQMSGEQNAASMRASFTKTLGQFMKPIRDFFQSYTCSHHRSVEYMVESMYYEQQPLAHRLQAHAVCQLVGYRCPDYATFKRGFCFLCRNQFECRSLVMSAGSELSAFEAAAGSEKFQLVQEPLAAQFPPAEGPARRKRVLPTLNQYKQNYKPARRNHYFFDTKPAPNFCLHHYHLLVKYRWFRITGSVSVERLRLAGSMGSVLSEQPGAFNKFTHHSYTLLLTHAKHAGQLDSLLLYGAHLDALKTQYIEHIDVSYLSNIDPKVRALNSARLCRTAEAGAKQPHWELAQLLHLDGQPADVQLATRVSLFVRCSPQNVLVRR